MDSQFLNQSLSSSSFPLVEQIPPQNIEAEELVLGGILLDQEAIGRIVDILTPDVFYLSAHRDIYEAAVSLYNSRQPTDIMCVAAWLKDHDKLNRVGGYTKLAELLERTVSAANIDYYASIVRDKYLRRQLLNAGNQLIRLAYNYTISLNEVLDQAEQEVFKVTQKNTKGVSAGLENVLTEVFNELDQRTPNDALPGLCSGFYDLDSLMQGLQRSDFIIVAARPSMGKTAFALQVARNVAEINDVTVVIFSLEMSRLQLGQRLVASEARINSNYLRIGRIAQKQWQDISKAIGTLSSLSITIVDHPSPSLSEIRSIARRIQAESEKSLGLIIIDYLQLLNTAESSENRVQEVSKITRSLKTLARELNVPVLALSQLSRAVESRQNKRPLLSDLRDSGAIEQDADVVIFLYRDEYYNPDTTDSKICELIVAKHRNGPIGTVKLLFNSECTRFDNLAC